MGNESDDEVLTLSADTFTALSQFYQEQDEREKMWSGENVDVSEEVKEDWQLSQFWYSKQSAETMAKMALNAIKEGGKIACVSAPTLYRAIKSINKDAIATVFEFDKRFAMYGEDFIFYDYKSPLSVPKVCREGFDLVFADPPFLSEECLTKTAVTMKYISKEPKKLVLCSGSVMEELAGRLLNLKLCKFKPEHENNLANEFCCYANFDFDSFL
eukprot:TRINITY_DN4125_c0_g1_i2.p1 TRINITY_DN4125_c0_g1~~TRINITY_DN4125_c0_g1_i2.p1  ORF type:complete len:214 (-),score=45.36 TRINITY_DN4125_c0_g1_i2:74-715(-)